MTFACLFFTTSDGFTQGTPFSFILDEPGKTSAGVFTTDGTLIRTLWSKVSYPAGTNVAVWDGLDDNSNAVAAGTYQIRLLQHNTQYVWDGAMGNTSAALAGPTVHTGFYPVRDMAIAETNAFYCSGYNEGKYDFCNFITTDPQHVLMKWSANGQPSNIYDRNWNWVGTDGSRVYFACSAATDPKNTATNDYPGFIVASNVGNNSPAAFTQGVPIINGMNTNAIYPNGVYVGTQPGLSGLAVQQNGNLLAVSVGPDNLVYLLDKLSGAVLGSFSVNSPGPLSFSPDGSLWVISANRVICFTNPGVAPKSVVTISGFSEPLAVAVNPTNANVVLVADGGSSQQLKAFSSAGASLWTYGLAGGYQSNGPAVTTNKFWFYDGEEDGTFLCFAPDGSFWVGDGGNHRSLHFSGALDYLEQIMNQPHSYMTCVDQNNSSRVFNQFLEFSVDYTKPLPQAWTLVNNWKANLGACNISWNEGLREVTTFTNGRTYALIDNNCASGSTVQELCELTTNGLRLTGIFPFENGGWVSLGPDGSARVTTIGAAIWYEMTLAGFDTNNNPIWNPPTLIASAPGSSSTDPVPRCCSFGNIRATISTNNVLISFDQSLNSGWHLGGIRVGGTNWLWRASPTATYLNGLGNYENDNGVTYAGDTMQAVGRNVIFGFHGEFFRSSGEAAQHMHFYDDGLFVGQFGEALNGHSAYEGAIPGFAGNGQCPDLVMTTNGDYYLWDNDESDHGPQRWHLVNARNIREQTGTGTLGSTITLTGPAVNFPTGVTGKSGNQSGELTWLPVVGVTSYNIRYSLINGGPYNILAGNTTTLDYVAGGLTNGQPCYFAVTAIVGGQECPPSEQVIINPFDTSQTVLLAGSMSEGGQYTPVIDVSSSAPTNAQPSYTGAEHVAAVLSLSDLNNYGFGNLQDTAVGTQGYYLFETSGPATGTPNVLAPFTFTYDYGFQDIAHLGRQYRLNNSQNLTMPNGMLASPTGALTIGVTDTNYHYLTVVSPAQFNNPRDFTLSLTSTNGASVQYSINESNGLQHTFQFLFKGQVTLLADGTPGGGANGDAIIQSIFFDTAAVTFTAPSVSLTNPTPVVSTTTVTSSQNPAPAGSNVIFTAAVSGSSGIPTGIVSFFDGTNGLGTGTLNGSGAAALNTTTLSASGSPHSITAVYTGDGAFSDSTSGVLSQIITNTITNTLPGGDITNGLVVYYPLAVNGNDFLGGNNLTLVGSPIFSSAAVNWNGAVPTVGYSSPQQWPQTGLTVSAWIDLANPTINSTIAACYGSYTNTVGTAYLQFYTWSGTLNARIIQDRDVNYIGRTTPASLAGGWHFVAATWNGGTQSSSVQIYLDGVQVDNSNNQSGTFTNVYPGSDVPLSVGAQLGAGFPVSAKFYGSQEQVRMYNRALSGSEINTLYTNEISFVTNPPSAVTGLRVIGQ
jgi:hypothetical protein